MDRKPKLVSYPVGSDRYFFPHWLERSVMEQVEKPKKTILRKKKKK